MIKDLINIPGYRIEKKLGQGGMATVYLGVQENLNREVAIKILNPDMFQDDQYLQRFLNEAHTASRLSHPNIVTIHDVGRIDRYCYIVMERLQESLIERVKFKPNGALHPSETFKILKQVAEALDYAHKEGFVHRDIKPDNILFRKDGTPVVVDFGIARARDSRAHLTSTGMIIGTPHYMSPEQCRGEELDGQSDFYSLGVVLYEIMTGQVPYRADSAAGILYKHVQEPIPQLPAPLAKYQQIVTRMMAKQKRERIHSGTELIAMIDAVRPDSRGETIKAIREDRWVFDDSGDSQATHVSDRSHNGAPDMSAYHTPLPHHPHHPTHHSKAPMVVGLLAIPFILLAIYFLFFQGPGSDETKPEELTDRPIQTEKGGAVETDGSAKNSGPETSTKSGASDKQAPETTGPRGRNTNGNNGADSTNTHTVDYTGFMNKAREALKKGDYNAARQNLRRARTVEETDETKQLAKEINDKSRLQKEENDYLEFLNKAQRDYEKGDLQGAKVNLGKAENFRTTRATKALWNKIDKKVKSRERATKKAIEVAAHKKRLQKKDDEAYDRARGRNTIYSYEKYLEKYPKGIHAAEAQKRYDQLKESTVLEEKIKEDMAYNSAVKSNSIAAYEDYLKKYPYGNHVNEANSQITQLKARRIKEIKIKVEVRRIRFFESARTAGSVESRIYGNRFAASNSRYIYTELEYENRLYRLSENKSNVKIIYKHAGGAMKTTEVNTFISPDKSVRNGFFSRGMGWSTPGNWPTGVYTVTVYVDNHEVGSSRFEVY